MKNLKKILALLVVTAMVAVIPGVCGMVAWAAEATLVSEDVMEIAEDVVYDAEAVEDVVYDTETVEDVVYDVESVEDVVYDLESVEEEVYNTVEGHIYFDGLSADIFALVIEETTASVFGEIMENDVAPIIRNDRTMLPARFVAENLGAAVEWDAEARVVTVKSDEVEIKLTIDSAVATVNGVEETLDSPAFIENDRTYTPVRYIAEKLGATVEWNDEFKMVIIVAAAEEVVEEEAAEEEATEEEAAEEEAAEEEATEEEVAEEETTEE